MNRYMQEKWPWIEASHGMRTLFMELMSDADLSFNPGGQNTPLGVLCREMGDIEYSYIQSLKTFTQDFSYHNNEAGLESSISQLKAWYQSMDEELQAIVSAFTDQDFQRSVARPSGSTLSVELQLDIYIQSLFIFFGKTTIYLKAMNKTLPKEILEYIG